MSDFSRDRIDANDEDRLPWLEAVEDEDDEPGVGVGRLIAALVVALVAIGLVVGGIFWLRDRNAAGGEGEVIAAPGGDYKQAPENPGGMQVEGTGDVAYGASEGVDSNSAIDLTAIPEAPVVPPGETVGTTAIPPSAPPAKTQTAQVVPAKPPVAAKPAPVAAKPVAPTPKPVPAKPPVAAAPPAVDVASGSGGGIQLGAFSSEAKANAAWKSMAGRFGFLAGVSHSVTPVKTGSGTLYRLRAAGGGDASGLCAKLKVAGETCAVVN